MGGTVKSALSLATFWSAVLTVSVVKLLLLHTYRSTDFEVHRNWLAITHSLPLTEWYYESTSEWTLDYPVSSVRPFFAYFEWVLSQVAVFFDPNMVRVENVNYASSKTVLFQKLTVIIADLVLAYSVQVSSGAVKILNPSKAATSELQMKLFALIFINGGLFMIDQIHFQYNGILFGILLLAMSRIIEGKVYQGAALFAILLNFKHIFLYMAPAFGVYLFRKYCYKSTASWKKIEGGSLLRLGLIVISAFTVSLFPFRHHIPQLLKRLFPFQRGLLHAYWAPNAWAGYSTVDLGLNFRKGKSSLTSGLIGEANLTVLPQIQPFHTFVTTVFFMTPSLYKLWQVPAERSFVFAVILTAWTSFMFGYHVHEKAIMNVIIPFGLVSFLQPKFYFLTLVAGTVSLFPLLFTPFEIVLKALIAIFHLTLSYSIVSPSLTRLEIAYISGFVPVYVFENFGYLILPQLPFLPLLVVSNYCFLGIFYCYCNVYINYLRSHNLGKISYMVTTEDVKLSPRRLRKRQ